MITIRGRTDKTLEKSWDEEKRKREPEVKYWTHKGRQGETIKIKKETIKQRTMALAKHNEKKHPSCPVTCFWVEGPPSWVVASLLCLIPGCYTSLHLQLAAVAPWFGSLATGFMNSGGIIVPFGHGQLTSSVWTWGQTMDMCCNTAVGQQPSMFSISMPRVKSPTTHGVC